MVLGAIGLFFLMSPAQADQEIPIDDGCPPSHTPKTTDANGDGNADSKLHNQTDSEGGQLELWCIDPNGVPGNGTAGNPYDEFYALIYIAPDGTRYFIGKCPFDGGNNDGSKTHNSTGVMENITWNSTDARNGDDDGDGSEDDVHYRFNVTTKKIRVEHTHNGTVIANRTIDAPNGTRFNFSDLPPKDPTNPDFWAMVEAPMLPGMGIDLPTDPWSHAALWVRVTWAGTTTPAAGLNVIVRNGPLVVAQAVTNEQGWVWFGLETDVAYIVNVQHAGPTSVPLVEPTTLNVEATQPSVPGSALSVPLIGIGMAVAIGVACAALMMQRRSRRETVEGGP